jgi:hypothetical protein
MAMDPVTAVAGVIDTIITRIFPDRTEAEKARVALEEMKQTGELQQQAWAFEAAQGQVAINVEEARSPSLFVAGWRPCIGWVCAAAWTWTALLAPAASWVLSITHPGLTLPDLHTDFLFELTLGMLGLGAMRSFEKLRGVAR